MIGLSELGAYAFIGFLVGVVSVNPIGWYRKHRFFKERGISAENWWEWIWVPASVVLWPLVLVILFMKWRDAMASKIRTREEYEEYHRLKARGWEQEWTYPEKAESRKISHKQHLSVVNAALKLKKESKSARAFLASVDRLKVMQEWLEASSCGSDPLIRLVDPELNRRRKLAWESQQEINRHNHADLMRENLERPGLSDQERRIICNLRQENSYHDPLEDDPEMGPLIRQVKEEVEVKNAGRKLRCRSLWYEIATTLRERHGIIWFPPSAMNPGVLYD